MNGFIPDELVIVPEDLYIVKFIHYEIGKSWNGDKVIVRFAIVEGEYVGIPLTRFYNVKLIGRGTNSSQCFEAPSRGALVREFRTLFPDFLLQPQVDLNAYKDKLIRAMVDTVDKDGLKQELANPNRYSVIRKLIEIIPDDYAVLFEDGLHE